MEYFTAIYGSLKNWIRNLSIKSKIQLISIGCLLPIAIVSLCITKIQMGNYNRLLQDSVSASLNYAEDDLVEKLENAAQLSYTILSDSGLQNRLGALKNTSQSTERATYYTQITSTLHSYLQDHQKDFISYISLYTDAFPCHTSARKAGALDDGQIADILSRSRMADGKPVWVTEYAAAHGLILTREIRQYKDLTLEPLGTLVLCIDLDSMLNSCPMFTSYDSFYFLLENEEGQLIYSTMEKDSNLPGSLEAQPQSGYQLVRIDSRWYFALQGTFYQKGWTYTCLVSYDSIYRTLENNMILSVVLLLSCILAIALVSRKLIDSLTRHFAYLIRKMRNFGSTRDSLVNFEQESTYDYTDRKDEVGMLHQQFDRMAHQISDLVEQNYTKELLVKEAQLKALEMQINPHFLYNTLESINWRAKAIGASQISLMVESLGNLFRAILQKPEESFTIREEIDLVENYLTIQKCRFESMLNYRIQADPALCNAQIPRMVIQPLAENAISHAMENLIEECFVEIVIERKKETLYIQVRNTGSHFEDGLLDKLKSGEITPRGFGIGLLNIDKRLRLMFGSGYGLTLYNENNMAVALVTMPYVTERRKTC